MQSKLSIVLENMLMKGVGVSYLGNKITTKIVENGKESIDVVDLSDISNLDLTPSARGTWDGWPVSNTYEHWLTQRYNKSVTSTTVAGVTIIINAIVKVVVINPYVKITVTIISGVVNFIVQNSVKRIYIEDNVSFRWTQIPNAAVQQRAVEKTVRTFYTDSNYATVIDTVTTTAYAKDYKD